jgi:hypothetical protein
MTTTTLAKRYTRLAHPPNFELTKRRLEINADICRYGLIRQDQLAALHPEFPYHALCPTLRLFFHNGFVARPREQEHVHKRVPGRLSTYLAPDRRGVQLHSAFFPDPVPTPKYSQQHESPTWQTLRARKNDQPVDWDAELRTHDKQRLTWGYMRHQHTTTTTALHYRLGAASVPGLSFFTEADLWTRYAPQSQLNQPVFSFDDIPSLRAHEFLAQPPENLAPAKARTPLQLKTRIDWPVRLPGNSQLTTLTIPVSTQPDGYFAHQQTAQPKFFFLESDEGTETILPGRNLRQSLHLFRETSLLQKYLIYIAAYRRRAHLKQLGITSFAVITVTTTPRRVGQIIERLAPHLAPFKIHPNFLLFTDRETLARYDNNPYHPDHVHTNLAGNDVDVLSA